jgi:hypothetical protein
MWIIQIQYSISIMGNLDNSKFMRQNMEVWCVLRILVRGNENGQFVIIEENGKMKSDWMIHNI